MAEGAPRRLPGSVAIVVAAAFLARVGAGAVLNLQGGTLRGYQFYRTMARRLLDGQGLSFPYLDFGPKWANRPPLYPLVLSGIEAGLGPSPLPILLLQSAVGAACVYGVIRLGLLLVDRGTAVLAGLLAAFYPYYLGSDTALVEQSLYAMLLAFFLVKVTGAFASAARSGPPSLRPAVAAGALGGLASLTREVFLPFFGLLLLWVLFRQGAGTARRRLAWCAVAASALICVCSPWLVRNAVLFGTPGWSFAGGKALWFGNNPHTFEGYPAKSIDVTVRPAMESLSDAQREQVLLAGDERQQDRVFRGFALENIRSCPGRFLGGGVRKVGALLSPVLTPGGDSVWKGLAYSLSYGPLVLLAAVGFWLRREALGGYFAVTLLALLSLAAVAFALWGQTRLRAPYDVLLFVPAAAGLRGGLAWFRAAGNRGIHGPRRPPRPAP